jgi:hypothetical protein
MQVIGDRLSVIGERSFVGPPLAGVPCSTRFASLQGAPFSKTAFDKRRPYMRSQEHSCAIHTPTDHRSPITDHPSAAALSIALLLTFGSLLHSASAQEEPDPTNAPPANAQALYPNLWRVQAAVAAERKAMQIPVPEGYIVASLTWRPGCGPEWVSVGHGPHALCVIPLGAKRTDGKAVETRDGAGAIHSLLLQVCEVSAYNEELKRPEAVRVLKELTWPAAAEIKERRRAIYFEWPPFRYCIAASLAGKCAPLPDDLKTTDRGWSFKGAEVGFEIAERWDVPEPTLVAPRGGGACVPNMDWYRQIKRKAPWSLGPPCGGQLEFTPQGGLHFAGYGKQNYGVPHLDDSAPLANEPTTGTDAAIRDLLKADD